MGEFWKKLVTLWIFWSGLPKINGQACLNTFDRYLGFDINPDKLSAISSTHSLQDQNDPVQECSGICGDNPNCGGFILKFSVQTECHLLDLSLPNDAVEFAHKWLKSAPLTALFKKNCLQGAISCNASLWYFDMVPNWSLNSEVLTTKTQKVSTANQCQQLCSNEEEFECRSTTYNSKSTQCFLSKFDRRSVPPGAGWLKHGTQNEIYMENQCAAIFRSGCEFRQMHGWNGNKWKIVDSNDINECQTLCDKESDFVCRSFSHDPGTRKCRITPDDTYSMVTVNVTNLNNAYYYQRANCLEAEMECNADLMKARFRTRQLFSGKFYAIGTGAACNFDINGLFNFDLNIPMEDKERCAIVEEQKHVYSSRFMMQYHDFVLTGMDRIYKFMCAFAMETQSVENSVDLKDPPTKEPKIVSGGSKRSLPRAVMRIVNGEGQAVSSAELGQTLYAEVSLRDDAGDYGIFVTNCEASVGDGSAPVKLLDTSGCPLDTNVFEGFSAVSGTNNKRLRAAFRGFRFETKSRVNINCDVNVCFQYCEPALCTDRNGRRIQSYGKKRKKRLAKVVSNNRFIGQIHVHSEFSVKDTATIHVTNTKEALRAPPPKKHQIDQTIQWLPVILTIIFSVLAFVLFLFYIRKRFASRKSYIVSH